MKPTATPFRTRDEDARVARLVNRTPIAPLQRRKILDSLAGNKNAADAALTVLAAFRDFTEQRREQRRSRGRPPDELRDWLVHRSQKIFEMARPSDARSAAAREFVKLMAVLAGVRLLHHARVIAVKPVPPAIERQRAIERIARKRFDQLAGDGRPKRGPGSALAAEILKRRAKGESIRKIANDLGTTTKTVSKYARKKDGTDPAA